MDSFRGAGIEPWGWIVNSSLAAGETSHPLLKKRAMSEQEQISRVQNDLSKRFAAVPMQANEPVGIEKLRGLCEIPASDAAA